MAYLDELNLQCYARNNPATLTDPGGTKPVGFAPGIKPMFLNVAGCVHVEFGVKFLIPNEFAQQDGWVVQQIKARTKVWDCNGNTLVDEQSGPFWEAISFMWIWLAAKVPDPDDTFLFSFAGACTRGYHIVTGEVKAGASWDLPGDFKEGAVPETGTFPSTNKPPVGWNKIGGTPHTMKVTWDCCNKQEVSVETQPFFSPLLTPVVPGTDPPFPL